MTPVHQPYRDWILSEPDEPLAPAHRAELETHLAACDSCRALRYRVSRMESLLGSAEMRGPAPGFSARFEARRAASQSRARLIGGGLVLLLGGGLLAGIAALSLFLAFSQAPGAALFVALVTAVTSSVPVINTVGEALLLGAQALLSWTAGQPALAAAALLGLAVVAVWANLVQRIAMETVQ